MFYTRCYVALIIMEIIQNDFSKELSELLKKHKKTITADKSGLHVVDCDNIEAVIIQKATVASEDYRDTLIFVVS
jgi:hypothetical protein